MKAIHFIQKDPKLAPSPIAIGSPIYQSGFWDITPERARAAVGASIYFHVRQTAPSFFGGTITDYEIKLEDPWKGRVIFTFHASREYKDFRTGADGWGMEAKFIY